MSKWKRPDKFNDSLVTCVKCQGRWRRQETVHFEIWIGKHRKKISIRFCPYCFEKIRNMMGSEEERHDEPSWIPPSERDPKDYRYEEILDAYKD